MGIWETVDEKEYNEKEARDDSCVAVLENNGSKLAQESRGPKKEPFQ